MNPFSLAEITRLRGYRRLGWKMVTIVGALQRHTRDEVVEAIDATVRFQDDGEALLHVNRVLANQAWNIPLVNGRETANWP